MKWQRIPSPVKSKASFGASSIRFTFVAHYTSGAQKNVKEQHEIFQTEIKFEIGMRQVQ